MREIHIRLIRCNWCGHVEESHCDSAVLIEGLGGWHGKVVNGWCFPCNRNEDRTIRAIPVGLLAVGEDEYL